MRKVGDKPEASVSEETIGQHKEELQEIAGQWSNGEVSSQDFNKAMLSRGWSPITALQSVLMSAVHIGRDLAKSALFMKEVRRGVLKMLDPLGREHRIEIDAPEPEEKGNGR
jgi:hypothetical protein